MGPNYKTKNENFSRADYISKFGNHASIALHNPNYQIFSIKNLEGIIGYRAMSQCAIIFGDPLCPLQNLSHLIHSFHDYCNKQRKNVIYISTSEKFKQWALQNMKCAALEIGSEVILDPFKDPKSQNGRKASQLRNKYNQSIRFGITVKEYSTYCHSLELAVKQFEIAWLKSRRGPQIFSLPVDIFAYRDSKRLFYAEHNNRIVAVLVLNRLDASQGWVLTILMTASDAPNIISEFMILSILETLAQEGCRFLSIGGLPPSELKIIQGLDFFSSWLACTTFKIIKKIFQLQNRYQYWEKFQPLLEPSYLILGNPKIRLLEIIGILRSFNLSL
jgi:lysylphosphatidylglycerol synthetase-like protein (DUF2156 family)